MRFSCRADEAIAAAAARVGIAVALTCERGGCGACRAELTRGTVRYLAPASQRRRLGEDGKLYELLCRAAPVTDVTLACVHPYRAAPARNALTARLSAP